MPNPPQQQTDPFQAAQNIIKGTRKDGLEGFNAVASPAQSGFNVRQSLIPNEREAFFKRNMVRWFIPETGIVEMYINPQNISYQESKHISRQRTKGGYLLQYWGEELEELTISGTTGSSGVEGINVLRDVYRSEQVSFDPFALALASDRDAENNDQFSFLGDFTNAIGNAGENFLDLVTNSIETGNINSTRPQPTLASLAFSVEMFWSGWVFRGFFTNFRVDERADNLGLFDYNMTFVVTQRRGLRLNFLPWHRSAVDGPSLTDPDFGVGVPYSFESLTTEMPLVEPVRNPDDGITVSDILGSAKDFIGDKISSIF